jgi:hypothetical protein
VPLSFFSFGLLDAHDVFQDDFEYVALEKLCLAHHYDVEMEDIEDDQQEEIKYRLFTTVLGQRFPALEHLHLTLKSQDFSASWSPQSVDFVETFLGRWDRLPAIPTLKTLHLDAIYYSQYSRVPQGWQTQVASARQALLQRYPQIGAGLQVHLFKDDVESEVEAGGCGSGGLECMVLGCGFVDLYQI